MEKIKGILVTLVAPMCNHIANGGEKLLGNASSIKRRNDGRVYISGQMQRHVLFSSINRLNLDDNEKGNTYVSNGDGIGNAIEVDLRSDLGGFMHPSAGSYSGRRTAPLSVTPAVALLPSEITRDLLVRMKIDTDSGSRDQALATKEQSDSDLMIMNFFLDITNLSISKMFTYKGGFHVHTDYVKHVTESERKRRVKLFLNATSTLIDYANEARNAVTGEPQKVLIVFDSIMSRKSCRYFEVSDFEQKNIISDLNSRECLYFLGDDTQGSINVQSAYNNAFIELNKSTLFDPCNGDDKILTFTEAFPQSLKNKVEDEFIKDE
jgi:CRISPR-associated protein Cst2